MPAAATTADVEDEAVIDEPLGVHMMSGEHLKRLLWQVHEGEHPEVVYMEMYASADHIGLGDILTEGDEDE